MKKLLLFMLLTLMLQAKIYDLNEKVADFSLTSQHGKSFSLEDQTRYIIVTYDKESTYAVNIFLQERPDFLAKNRALFIVDFSVIPTAIFKLFVKSKMEAFAHPILYSFDVEFSKTLPYEAGAITVMRLEKKKVKKISFAKSDEALAKLLK